MEFEPSATALEKEGAGYVVASLGVDSGYVPYTSYSAKTSYMEKNPEIIQKFTDALQKGMEYVQTGRFPIGRVGCGRDYEVTVNFEKFGTKKMFASFAKLKKI